MNSNLIYDIGDSPKTIKEWILYALQQVMAVFVATVLIANICGTPIDSCLVASCIGTLVYQLLTFGKSPMYISSSGATCSAVIGAMALGSSYTAVVFGGLCIMAIYSIFAGVVYKFGIGAIDKLLPPVIVGSITMVIGANLATFIPTYVQVNGAYSNAGVLIAIFTMLIVAITSHYFKGFLRTIPFLLGLLGGYILSALLTITGVCSLIDFSVFANISLFHLPDFSFTHISTVSLQDMASTAILFIPVSLAGICEHYSDHQVLSNMIGTDLTHEPGLHRTLVADGFASLIGTLIGSLPNTSYGEGIATIGFSRVASRKVVTLAAIIIGIMGFIQPIQLFIQSVPQCVFGGCAMVLYGYIFASGLKTIKNKNVDLEKNKNLVIMSVIITVGVSGLFLFNSAFTGVSLAMVLGVILNLILIEK